MESDSLNRQSVHAIKSILVIQRIIEFIETFCEWDKFKEMDKVFLFWVRFDNAQYSNFCELSYFSKKNQVIELVAKPIIFDSRVADKPDADKIAERIGVNTLHKACKDDDIETIKALKEQGVDLERKLWGLTLSQIALRENRPSQVALYLCEFESKEDHLRTLQEATDSGDFTVIQKLVDTLNVNPIEATTKKGNGLLHISIKSFPMSQDDKINVMTYYLKKGLDVNLLNEDDESALELAIREQEPEVVQFLRDQGAIEPKEE